MASAAIEEMENVMNPKAIEEEIED